jgi:hypothetical protein
MAKATKKKTSKDPFIKWGYFLSLNKPVKEAYNADNKKGGKEAALFLCHLRNLYLYWKGRGNLVYRQVLSLRGN